MTTMFIKLNDGWNAEPNAPSPQVSVCGKDVVLEFLVNEFLQPQYKNAEKGILHFSNCWRYRLGSTNDEGWYHGQCRFSRIAPAWGEFYEVKGDLLLNAKLDPKAFYSEKFGIQLTPDPLEWITINNEMNSSRHFLFYLRDETFECDATDWNFSVKWLA